MTTLMNKKANDQVFPNLLNCLKRIGLHYGRKASDEVILHAIPIKGKNLTIPAFIMAAENLNLKAGLVQIPLAEIKDIVLPIILLLKDNQACILSELGEGELTVLLPDKGFEKIKYSLEDMEASYAGAALYLKPLLKRDTADKEELKAVKRYKWFWSTIVAYKHQYLLIGLASFMINILALAGPLFMMNVYDRVIPNQAFASLWALTFGVLIAFSFDFVIKQLRSVLMDVIGNKINCQLGSSLMKQFLSLRAEHKPPSVGGFSNELNGYESLREFFTSASIAAIFDLPFVFIFLWLVFYIGGPLVYIPLLSIPIIIIASLIFSIPMQRAQSRIYQADVKKQVTIMEALMNFESLKSLNAERMQFTKWQQTVGASAINGIKSKHYGALIVNFTGFIVQLVSVVTIVVGVYLIDNNASSPTALTMGGLIACTILCSRILAPLSQLVTLLTRLQQSRLGLRSLDKLMLLPTEIKQGGEKIYRQNFHGNIRFDEVSFAYPGQKHLSLEKISFSIKAGEKVGIIGRVGAGKSTLLRLILSLYQAKDGHLFLDDVDIDQLEALDVRHAIGYVCQDSSLFSGTLKENLKIAKPDISDERFLEICQQTGVDEFVRRHPDGYDLMVQERGENLSVGQRQLVCVARALMPDPSVLLFDEPTSSMDGQVEMGFIKMIAHIGKEKTVVLVTHKHSMLSLVDRIVILDAGKLVTDGQKEAVLHQLQQNEKNR